MDQLNLQPLMNSRSKKQKTKNKHGTTQYRPNNIYNKKISKAMREEIIQNTKEASKFRKEKQGEVI